MLFIADVLGLIPVLCGTLGSDFTGADMLSRKFETGKLKTISINI